MCMSNTKQLGLAWTMYAGDYREILPPNQNGGGARGWVDGWLDFTVNHADNTNTVFLTKSKLGPYTQSVGIYRCPADNFLCKVGGKDVLRVRSVSMNGFLEGYAYGNSPGSTWYPDYFAFNKMTDIINPAPSSLWVFDDEHPDSINDGWEITNVTDRNSWTDLPASYHNRAGGFNFADGHSEIKSWKAKSTEVKVKRQQYNGFPIADKNYIDIDWMIAHSSAKRK